MSIDQNSGEAVRRWDSWVNCFLLVLFVFFFFNLWQTVHERWVVEREAGAGGLQRIVDFHGEAIALGLIGLAIIFIVWTVRRPKPMWRFLYSMRLGIVLMATILLSTVIGTLVLQNAPQEKYINFYSEPVFAFFKAVHFTNLFRSWWFLALSVLLGVNLVACTVRRKAWRVPRLGLLMAHWGIVIFILGAMVGGLFAFKGAIVLTDGQSTDHVADAQYVEATGGNFSSLAPEAIPERHRIPLGGTLRLDKFEEIEYEDPFIVNVLRMRTGVDVDTGRQTQELFGEQSIKFDDDRPLTIRKDKGVLRIKKFYRNLRRARVVEPGGGGPLASVLVWSGSRVREAILTPASLEEPLEIESFRLRFAWSEPSADELKRLGIVPTGPPHVFSIRDKDGKEVASVALAENENVGYYHDFAMRRENGELVLSNSSERLRNQVVQVELSGGGITPEKILLPAYMPAPHGDRGLGTSEQTGLQIRYSPRLPSSGNL